MARMTFTFRSRSGGKAGAGNRIAMTVFFLLFAGMGSLFFSFGFMQVLQTRAVRGWTPTTCTIEASSTRHDADKHRHYFEVRYSYTVGGAEPHRSTTVVPDYDGSDDAAEVQRLAHRHPVGAQGVCFVNPDNPAEATLQLPSYSGAFLSLFALPFMGVGFGGLFFTWRPQRRHDRPVAISDSARLAGRGAWFGVAFCSLFVLIGLGLLYPLFVRPLVRMQQAQHWPAVPCTILASSVQSHDSDDGTTYSVDILFAYDYQHVTYRSNRYSFGSGSSSGHSGKQAIVQQYPVGSQHTCYVNPADPFEAVLHRGWTGMMWAGLIPLAFVIFGLGAGTAALVSLRRSRAGRDPLTLTQSIASRRPGPGTMADPVPLVRSSEPIAARRRVAAEDWLPPLNLDQPAVFRAKRRSALGGAIFLLIFGAFWNGITWMLLVRQVVEGWRDGPTGLDLIFPLFLTLFAVPFVLVGLAVPAGFVYMLLKMFNPLPKVALGRAVVPLGGVLDVSWELLGKVDRVRQLTLTLEGAERATYRRGTDTTTDEHVFVSLPIAQADRDRGQPMSGRTSVKIPADTIHSFKSNNNQIVWRVRVHGEIRLWPDVSETFDIAVLPAEEA